jgi:alpha-L-fucosidase 2
MIARLPKYEINADGAIREWLHADFIDNYHHRHLSHLYPLFPGNEITRHSDPTLFEACRVAVEKRLVIGLGDQSGWSLSHLANIYARLEQGDRALQCLEILSRTCVGANLFTYHNDGRKQGITMDMDYPGIGSAYQIDANLGWTAAILEMLVASSVGRITLLPALPSAWQRGAIRGVGARGGVTVDLAWDLAERRIDVTLQADEEQSLVLALPRAMTVTSAECRDSADSTHSVAISENAVALTLASQRAVHVTLRT